MNFPLKGAAAMEKENKDSIEEYITKFPKEIQDRLRLIRQLIREIVPDATEKISYQMPTFYLNGNLVHYAAFKNHIGFYPTPSGIEKFQGEISVYKNAKGSVQFPYSEPLPVELIRKMVEYRVDEMRRKKK